MEFRVGTSKRFYQYGSLEIDFPKSLEDWDFDWEYSAYKKTPKITSFKKNQDGNGVTIGLRRRLPHGYRKAKKIKTKIEEVRIRGKFACLEIEKGTKK